MDDITGIELNLPAYDYRLGTSGGCLQIFDAIRKKFVPLTPEEWVRQHFVNYMVEYMGVPKGLIMVEVALKINDVAHRADIVAYSRMAEPLMVVECKSVDVQLSSAVIEQVCRYNVGFNAAYILVTNGLRHVCVKIKGNGGSFEVVKIPHYDEMSG